MVYEDDQRVRRGAAEPAADLGLDVQIESLQQAAWNERWMAGDYDWIFNGSVADADPDDGHWNFFPLDGPWNTTGYKNQEVNDLLVGTRTIGDQEERAALFQQAQAILQQDVRHAFIHHTIDITGFSNDVQGYVPIPEMRYLETVWLDRVSRRSRASRARASKRACDVEATWLGRFGSCGSPLALDWSTRPTSTRSSAS